MNTDRLANIIDALNTLGETTPTALAAWLGRPYFFERNIAALIADGTIVENVKTSRHGVIVRISLA